MSGEQAKSDYLMFLEENFQEEDARFRQIFEQAIADLERRNSETFSEMDQILRSKIEDMQKENQKLQVSLQNATSKNVELADRVDKSVASLREDVRELSGKLALLQGVCVITLGVVGGFAAFVVYG